jgi:thiamine biosynthesis lipoprotein
MEDGKIIKENPAMQLNFNAVAQGYSVDVLGKYFEEKGIHQYIIDVGGEILTGDKKPNGDLWKVGIEIPEEDSENRFYNRVVVLQDEAVATSGNYRKFYVIDGVKYAHSLDPKTGYPVQHSLLSSTVIAPTAGEADAYATAFMVMGVEKTLEFVKNHPQIKVYLMFDEKGEVKIAMSDNFKAYLKKESE